MLSYKQQLNAEGIYAVRRKVNGTAVLYFVDEVVTVSINYPGFQPSTFRWKLEFTGLWD